MPLIVDKAERRALVARVAFDIVADSGIGSVTFRQVADATGTSTAIVTNYFRDKNDLLFEVYRTANRRAMAGVEAAFDQGLPLLDCLAQVLPVTEQMHRNWRVWLAFWGVSHSEPTFARETADNARASLELYTRMLRLRYDVALQADALDQLARRLLAAVGGVGLQACLAPAEWPLDRLRRVIADELAALDASVGS